MPEKITDKFSVGAGQTMKLDNFVESELCRSWLKKIFNNSKHLRSPFENLYSYGHSWYLELESGNLHTYHAKAMQTNELLQNLDGLTEALIAVAAALESPTGKKGLKAKSRRENLGPYWADAGVILSMDGKQGAIHADYEGLAPYPEMMFSPDTRAYSAVLCLASGASGGGLRVWKKRFLADVEVDLDLDLEKIESVELQYSSGSLAVFDSFLYHQILPTGFDKENRYRAVAAIHFLFKDSPTPHWEYWF